jgi:hypothetical protein
MTPESNSGSSLDDRLTARREHLMTEVHAQSHPARLAGPDYVGEPSSWQEASP